MGDAMALALSKGKAAWAGLILTSSAERLGSTIFRWPRACPAGRMSRPLPSRSAFATKQPAPQKQPSQVEIGFSRIETALTDPPQRQGATVASFRAALLGANVSDRAAPAPTVNSEGTMSGNKPHSWSPGDAQRWAHANPPPRPGRGDGLLGDAPDALYQMPATSLRQPTAQSRPALPPRASPPVFPGKSLNAQTISLPIAGTAESGRLERAWTVWGNESSARVVSSSELDMEESWKRDVSTWADFQRFEVDVARGAVQLRDGGNVCLFARGVRPTWESTQAHGKWVLLTERRDTATRTLALMRALIAAAHPNFRHICGIQLSLRPARDCISVWSRRRGDASGFIRQTRALLIAIAGLGPQHKVNYLIIPTAVRGAAGAAGKIRELSVRVPDGSEVAVGCLPDGRAERSRGSAREEERQTAEISLWPAEVAPDGARAARTGKGAGARAASVPRPTEGADALASVDSGMPGSIWAPVSGELPPGGGELWQRLNQLGEIPADGGARLRRGLDTGASWHAGDEVAAAGGGPGDSLTDRLEAGDERQAQMIRAQKMGQGGGGEEGRDAMQSQVTLVAGEEDVRAMRARLQGLTSGPTAELSPWTPGSSWAGTPSAARGEHPGADGGLESPAGARGADNTPESFLREGGETPRSWRAQRSARPVSQEPSPAVGRNPAGVGHGGYLEGEEGAARRLDWGFACAVLEGQRGEEVDEASSGEEALDGSVGGAWGTVAAEVSYAGDEDKAGEALSDPYEKLGFNEEEMVQEEEDDDDVGDGDSSESAAEVLSDAIHEALGFSADEGTGGYVDATLQRGLHKAAGGGLGWLQDTSASAEGASSDEASGAVTFLQRRGETGTAGGAPAPPGAAPGTTRPRSTGGGGRCALQPGSVAREADALGEARLSGVELSRALRMKLAVRSVAAAGELREMRTGYRRGKQDGKSTVERAGSGRSGLGRDCENDTRKEQGDSLSCMHGLLWAAGGAVATGAGAAAYIALSGGVPALFAQM